jgi:hypothetical protein
LLHIRDGSQGDIGDQNQATIHGFVVGDQAIRTHSPLHRDGTWSNSSIHERWKKFGKEQSPQFSRPVLSSSWR